MAEILQMNRPEEVLPRRNSSDCDGVLGRRGTFHFDDTKTRPILKRRISSFQRQLSSTDKPSSGNSYFNLSLPYVTSSGSTPPPYFSPPPGDLYDEDKQWIELLERQNRELMEQITTLSNATIPPTQKRARPVSYHGSLAPKDLSVSSPSTSSNMMVQKQLLSMQEELAKTRRRCAELSEMEARKKGLELRCLGLERVVEDLVSAVEFLKTHSNQSTIRNATSKGEEATENLKGLGLHFEREAREITISGRSVRTSFSKLMVWSRRRIIPYRLRAVILFILSQFRTSDLVERLVCVGIIVIGAVLWAAFLFAQRGRKFIKKFKNPG